MRRALIATITSLLITILGVTTTSSPVAAFAQCAGVTATIEGTSGNDVLTGTPGNDVIAALEGDDVIRGLEGNDTLCGGPGNDRTLGGPGDDRMVEDAFDADARNTLAGGAGNDLYDGGVGFDLADFSDPSGGATSVTADLTAGTATGEGTDELDALEAVRGTAGNDTITGNAAGNTLNGLGGNDTIRGANGDDTIAGGPGNDVVDGQFGEDRASYAGAAGPVVANLSTRSATGEGTDTLDRLEGIVGSRFNDRLTGAILAETLEGGPGNDVVDGMGGSDYAAFDSATSAVTADLATGTATGQGTDTLRRIENLRGGIVADVLRGNDAANTLRAGPDDVVEGRGGNDTLLEDIPFFSLPSATVSYASAPGKVTVDLSADTASGAAGDDRIYGFADIVGSNFSDRLTCDLDGYRCTVDAMKGDDAITGTKGYDDLYGRLGNDRIDGRDGGDTAHYDGTLPVNVNLATGTATGQGTDTLAGIESAVGSSAADTMTGAGGNTCFLLGGSGNDTLRSTGVECVFHGDDGNDTLVGTEYDDSFYPGPGNDTVQGLGGDDEIAPDAGADRLDGGTGTDRMDFLNRSAGPLNANLATGVVTAPETGTDAVVSVEDLRGSNGNDTIRGTDGPNQIEGAYGNDTISGGGGNDDLRGGYRGTNVLNGGPGSDYLVPSFGNDTVNGGPDIDTVTYEFTSAPVSVNLATGSATGQGTDSVVAVENVNGSGGDDVLQGDGQSNVIDGRAGTDTCTGGGGTDTLLNCP